MDQKKTGKWIAALRAGQKLTQRQLAERLGVTDRAVSNWENGRRLPDYSLLPALCAARGVSVNELFCGEKIPQEQLQKRADDNLLKALEQTGAFDRRDKIAFYKRKWKRDHRAGLALRGLLWLGLAAALWLTLPKPAAAALCALAAPAPYILSYNRMMAYVEEWVYGRHTCKTGQS